VLCQRDCRIGSTAELVSNLNAYPSVTLLQPLPLPYYCSHYYTFKLLQYYTPHTHSSPVPSHRISASTRVTSAESQHRSQPSLLNRPLVLAHVLSCSPSPSIRHCCWIVQPCTHIHRVLCAQTPTLTTTTNTPHQSWHTPSDGTSRSHYSTPVSTRRARPGLRVMTGATAYRATLDYHLLFRKSRAVLTAASFAFY
jgi:hypothetical protein